MTAAEYRLRVLGEHSEPARHEQLDRKPRATPEADFQTQVIELAQALGWRVAHFRPARTEKGWRTPVAADGAGFPDLILCRRRDRRMIAAELKSQRGKLTEAQDRWLMDLQACGAERFVWRPDDLPLVAEVLR